MSSVTDEVPLAVLKIKADRMLSLKSSTLRGKLIEIVRSAKSAEDARMSAEAVVENLHPGKKDYARDMGDAIVALMAIRMRFGIEIFAKTISSDPKDRESPSLSSETVQEEIVEYCPSCGGPIYEKDVRCRKCTRYVETVE